MNYKIRKILEGEVSLLQDFLYEAIFVPEGMPAPPKSIINQPELQVYITDFGKKKDDIGLVAGRRICPGLSVCVRRKIGQHWLRRKAVG